MTTPELEAIRGHSSAASFATGPVMAEPFISPLGLTICVCQPLFLHQNRNFGKSRLPFPLTTPALSSKYRKTPSARLHGLLCRTITAGMTFFLSSGFPFLTVAMTMSPAPPAGRRLRRAPMPLTEMMYRLRAPELSQQFMTAPLCLCQPSPNCVIVVSRECRFR
jgi:hypothetical protein